jgi:hypothetical protein
MLKFKTIHQTDKVYDPADKRVRTWKEMHEGKGWEWRFYSDEEALRWIDGKAGWGRGDNEDKDEIRLVEPTDRTHQQTGTSTLTSTSEELTNKGFNLVELDARTPLVAPSPSSDSIPREPERGVMWAWEYMKRGVMRADFFRYLVVLLEGGVVSPTPCPAGTIYWLRFQEVLIRLLFPARNSIPMWM